MAANSYRNPVVREVIEAMDEAGKELTRLRESNRELIAALKAVQQVDFDDSRWHKDKVWKQIDAAIAKAEGRT